MSIFSISYQKVLNHQVINKEKYDRDRGTGFYVCSLAWACCVVLCSNSNLMWALTFQAKFRRNSKQGHSDLQGLTCTFFSFAMCLLPPSITLLHLPI